MKLKRIHFLINPASGVEKPVLFLLNKYLTPSGISWDVTITHKGDTEEIIKQKLSRLLVDAIGIVGGDGTISTAARALYKKQLPLIFLPGGTANMFARSLGVPPDFETMLTHIAEQKLKEKKIDMGIINGKPMLMGISAGLIAESVVQTARGVKNTSGQRAYLMKGFQLLREANPQEFKMRVDGNPMTIQAAGLVIANGGSFSLGGVEIFETMPSDDGYLDIVSINNADIPSFIQLGASALIAQSNKERRNLSHWRVKKLSISFGKDHTIVLDDEPVKTPQTYTISLRPKSLTVLIPK